MPARDFTGLQRSLWDRYVIACLSDGRRVNHRILLSVECGSTDQGKHSLAYLTKVWGKQLIVDELFLRDFSAFCREDSIMLPSCAGPRRRIGLRADR
ncbi:MAG: hypothetical protein AB1486_28370 [Planctomycetota bacterium]